MLLEDTQGSRGIFDVLRQLKVRHIDHRHAAILAVLMTVCVVGGLLLLLVKLLLLLLLVLLVKMLLLEVLLLLVLEVLVEMLLVGMSGVNVVVNRPGRGIAMKRSRAAKVPILIEISVNGRAILMHQLQLLVVIVPRSRSLPIVDCFAAPCSVVLECGIVAVAQVEGETCRLMRKRQGQHQLRGQSLPGKEGKSQASRCLVGRRGKTLLRVHCQCRIGEER